jgi:Xaa-Pro dipeptidase
MKGYTGLPIESFTRRIKNIQRELSKKGLDALFVFSDEYRPGSTLYLSDYYPINVVEESPQGVYVPLEGEVVLFLGSINAQTARAVSWIKDIRSIEKIDLFFQRLQDREGRLLKIGLVGEALLPVRYYRKLKPVLDKNDFVYADDIINQMRAIKSPDEIERMQKAARLGDAAITEAVTRLKKEKMTERELAAVAEYVIRTGGGNIGSATIVSAGIHTKMPTWRPSDKTIEPGEMVLIDVNPSLRGYCADVATTVFNGNMEEEKKKILSLSKQILRGVINHMQPGLPASTIYNYFLKRVRESGYEQFFTPYAKGMRAVGHGIGLDVVEWPNLDKDSKLILKPGMTFGVKFDLHGFDFGGVRFEVDVLVEENGCRSLNNILCEGLF